MLPEKNNIACTDETRDRLRREANELFQSMQGRPGQAGSAEPVIYDRTWAETHGIGSFGRMTISSDKVVYHAAPRDVDRRERFTFGDSNVFSYTRAWVDGNHTDNPYSSLVAVNTPELKRKVKGVSTKHYECKLFGRLLRTDSVTLVNPSFSSMAALLQHTTADRPGYITLTSTEQYSAWVDQIRDFVSNSGGRIFLNRTKVIVGIAYLGSVDPVWYPDDSHWCRLVPSPLVEQVDQYMTFSSVLEEHGFYSHYDRKGHTVSASLIFSDNVYRWNPETVDQNLDQKEKRVFLESNRPLDLLPIENHHIVHKPFFLPDYGVWEGEWNTINDVIYDVKGKDTYLSRRARNPAPEGKKWVDYVVTGPYIVTASCNMPFKNPKVSIHYVGDREILSLDGSIPVSVERIVVTKGEIQNLTDLPCETFMFVASERDDLIFKSDNFYFNRKSRTEDGLSWQPYGQSFLPKPFGRQALQTLPIFSFRDGLTYIDVSSLSPGMHCVASSKENLFKVIPELYAYTSKKWFGRDEWSHIPIESHDGGLGGGNNIATQIIDVLRFHNKTSFQPMSSYDISSILGYSTATIEIYCYRLPDVYQWAVKKKGYHQWIHREDLKIKLIDGLSTYQTALENLVTYGCIRSKYGFGYFHEFALINNINLHLVREEGEYLLRLWTSVTT